MLVRDVPDFPKTGILFRDITPVLAAPQAFRDAIDLLAEPYVHAEIDVVLGIESRGFILAAPLALQLGAAFVPVRKPGKLPCASHRVEYALEYGSDALEIHKDAFFEGARVLLVDDVIATGGTAKAALELARKQGAQLVGAAFLLELSALRGRACLGDVPSSAVLTY